jgi:DNA polymerase III alpha subunit
MDKHTTVLCGEIDASLAGETVIIAGMVSSVRRITTKNDRLMVFSELEDLQGSTEVVVFPGAYEKTSELWQPDNILLVRGRVQVRDDDAKVICESAVDYHSWVQGSGEREDGDKPARVRRQLHISIPRSGDQEEDVRLLGEVHSLLTGQPGEDVFTLYVRRADRSVQLIFPNETTTYSPTLAKAVADLLGDGSLRIETLPGR